MRTTYGPDAGVVVVVGGCLRDFHWKWWGQLDVLAETAVWQMLQAVVCSGFDPAWVSENSSISPPPRELEWQVRQSPMVNWFPWYCSD